MVTQNAALFRPKAPTRQELAEDLAAPAAVLGPEVQATGAVRKAVDDLITIDLTPASAIRAMRAARDLSDVPLFAKVALEALRRDPNLRSLMQTRVLAVASLPLVAEVTGKKLQDRKAAEAAQEVLDSEAVEDIVPHLLLQGIYLGYGAAQNFIDSSFQPWVLTEIRPIPAHFMTFSRLDATTPYVLPQEQGGKPEQLLAGKHIYHRPGMIAGNPLTSSIAYTVLFYYALKNLVLKDWMGFVELYGQPVRVGKYPKGIGNTPAGKKDLDVLKRALRDLGGDAWAMLPEDMKIEFVEAASRNSSAEVFERMGRFLDEQVAKLVSGGTLTSGTGNTGSGGSQALGVVHNELRTDILKADAKAMGTTLRRHLIRPLTVWNFGANVQVPKVYFQVEEAEDVAAKVKAICDLSDRGWKVPTAELYALLDVRAPEGDEEVIGGKAPEPEAPAAPAGRQEPDDDDQDEEDDGVQGMTARFNAGQGADAERDELDDLSDELFAEDGYARADAEADAALLAAIEGASTVEELKAALIAAVKTAGVEVLQAAYTTAGTAARLAGEFGAEIGAK